MTFNTRAGAEAAKQDLQVKPLIPLHSQKFFVFSKFTNFMEVFNVIDFFVLRLKCLDFKGRGEIVENYEDVSRVFSKYFYAIQFSYEFNFDKELLIQIDQGVDIMTCKYI